MRCAWSGPFYSLPDEVMAELLLEDRVDCTLIMLCRVFRHPQRLTGSLSRSFSKLDSSSEVALEDDNNAKKASSSVMKKNRFLFPWMTKDCHEMKPYGTKKGFSTKGVNKNTLFDYFRSGFNQSIVESMALDSKNADDIRIYWSHEFIEGAEQAMKVVIASIFNHSAMPLVPAGVKPVESINTTNDHDHDGSGSGSGSGRRISEDPSLEPPPRAFSVLGDLHSPVDASTKATATTAAGEGEVGGGEGVGEGESARKWQWQANVPILALDEALEEQLALFYEDAIKGISDSCFTVAHDLVSLKKTEIVGCDIVICCRRDLEPSGLVPESYPISLFGLGPMTIMRLPTTPLPFPFGSGTGTSASKPFQSFVMDYELTEDEAEAAFIERMEKALESASNFATIQLSVEVCCEEIFAVRDAEGLVVQGSATPQVVTHTLQLENTYKLNEKSFSEWRVVDIDNWLGGNKFWKVPPAYPA